MRTKTTKIDNRLDRYGRAVCVVPGCVNRRETVFTRAGNIHQLVCRNHPGHPLYTERGRHEVGAA